MKRDAALAALNSNYANPRRVRCLLMSHEPLWGLDMRLEPHITVSVAEVGWQVTQNRLYPLRCIKTRWTWHSSNRWIHSSYSAIPFLSPPLPTQRPQDSRSIPTDGRQGWKGATRTSVEESGLSHEGKSIRTLRWTVNIYSFSLTTIEFPWWALTVQGEGSELMAIVLHSSKCIICLIQRETLHQTRENPAAYWWMCFVWGLRIKDEAWAFGLGLRGRMAGRSGV